MSVLEKEMNRVYRIMATSYRNIPDMEPFSAYVALAILHESVKLGMLDAGVMLEDIEKLDTMGKKAAQRSFKEMKEKK